MLHQLVNSLKYFGLTRTTNHRFYPYHFLQLCMSLFTFFLAVKYSIFNIISCIITTCSAIFGTWEVEANICIPESHSTTYQSAALHWQELVLMATSCKAVFMLLWDAVLQPFIQVADGVHKNCAVIKSRKSVTVTRRLSVAIRATHIVQEFMVIKAHICMKVC